MNLSSDLELNGLLQFTRSPDFSYYAHVRDSAPSWVIAAQRQAAEAARAASIRATSALESEAAALAQRRLSGNIAGNRSGAARQSTEDKAAPAAAASATTSAAAPQRGAAADLILNQTAPIVASSAVDAGDGSGAVAAAAKREGGLGAVLQQTSPEPTSAATVKQTTGQSTSAGAATQQHSQVTSPTAAARSARAAVTSSTTATPGADRSSDRERERERERDRDRDRNRTAAMIGLGSAATAAASHAGSALSVLLYLPDARPLQLRVPLAVTVQEVISEALRMARAEAAAALAEAGTAVTDAAVEEAVSWPLVAEPRCYDLRMHDAGGQPDLDFPALERSRMLRYFDESGAHHEYCLRVNTAAITAYKAQTGPGGVRSPGAGPQTPGSSGARPISGLGEMLQSMTGANITGGGGGGSSSSSRYGGRSALSPTPHDPYSPTPMALQPPPSLRVVIPGHPSPTVVMVPYRAKEDMRVQDVINFVARRHRLNVYLERYVLLLPPADAQRLNLPNRELPAQALVQPLLLDTVELVKKNLADSPPAKETSAGSQLSTKAMRMYTEALYSTKPGRPTAAVSFATALPDGGSAANSMGESGSLASSGSAGDRERERERDRLRSSRRSSALVPGGIIHNAISASEYQEWLVVKVNRRGKRQDRILGIDGSRLVNKKLDRPRIGSDKPAVAERLISDISRIEVPDSRSCELNITFREDGEAGGGGGGGWVGAVFGGRGPEEVTLTYEAKSSAEREDIVHKLQFILQMSGDASKLVRVP